MIALEQLINPANPKGTQPWHPETLDAIEALNVAQLPEQIKGDGYRATGFEISGDDRFIKDILKDRFLRNPSVSFAFKSTGWAVTEYEKIPSGEGV